MADDHGHGHDTAAFPDADVAAFPDADDFNSNSNSNSNSDDEGTDTDTDTDSNSNSDADDHEALPAPPEEATSTAPHAATPNPNPNGGAVAEADSDEQRRQLTASGSFDESRRLFQRLWTDEEELVILRGFLDFTSRRGTTFASHQYDTGPFYEEVRRRLQFDFSKNQLIEKLRRLKKKYRTCADRMLSLGPAFAFRSPHEQAIYDVARHIWRPKRDSDDDNDINPPPPPAAAAAADAIDHANSAASPPPVIAWEDGSVAAVATDGRTPRQRRRVRRRALDGPDASAAAAAAAAGTEAAVPVMVTVENSIPASAMPGAVEETVRSCLSPLLKELISSAVGAGPLSLGIGGAGDLLGLGMGGGLLDSLGAPADEKWRRQQILELEVYLKRIELVREQVTATLEELRSSGG